MIQPLGSARTTWYVYWLDLTEPVPAGKDYFLPTMLVVTDAQGAPLGPPEIVQELEQRHVENALERLFESAGTPDVIAIGDSDEWEHEEWKTFAQEHGVEIRFQQFEQPDSIQKIVKTVVYRQSAEGNDEEARSQEVAIGLLNTALRTRSVAKRKALVRTALEHWPEYSDARVEQGDLLFQDGDWKAAAGAYEEVVTRETPRWMHERVTWWSTRETRPFLRAIYGRAMTLWHQGRHADAALDFEALLALNPIDHQGARFFIPLLYLLAEDHQSAAAAFQRYENAYAGDYGEPALLFGWALSLYFEGREAEAKERYHKAILRNIYIAPMLLETAEPRRAPWHPNDRSEPAYASEFLDSYSILWDRDAGALRLLREAWEAAGPAVDEIIAHREALADFQDQRFDPEYRTKWNALVELDERLTSREAPKT